MVHSRRIASGLCANFFFVFCCAPVFAGTFSVSPVRVSLDARHPIGVVTLHNDDAQPVVVQVDVEKWTQSKGRDKYSPTPDIIGTPPVFTLSGHGAQIVRFALVQPNTGADEQAYRVFFEQVPGALPKTFNGVNLVFRLGIPVFVRGSASGRVAQSPQIVWSAQESPGGELTFRASNHGTVHVEINSLQVSLGKGHQVDAHRFKYVLPGHTVSWNWKVPKNIAPSTVLVHGTSDSGPITARVSLAR